ncbi:hypothetical protein [Actinophytocola sp.]|uniref:hypothetical protein n=1 Tax=Actinophytocola sp. TaxID=1872138 RepID=UPI002ED3607E
MNAFTTDHHYEVFGDATMIALPDRTDDVLVEPMSRNQEYMALVSDRPLERAA